MTWSGKRVLVTGAGGFIGSHLAERLVELGADVRGFVHYNAFGAAGWLDHSPARSSVRVMAGDVTDRGTVHEAMQGIDIVFHLAALIGIPYSYHAPESYVRTNIEGTLTMLQAARELGIKLLVQTSTSEVYGTAQQSQIDETHPLQGQSPYSATKIAADKLAEAYHLSFQLPVVTVRPFNTFGPRQSARAIVPTIIAQCLASDRVRLGSLYPTRDLNYVADTVTGFVCAASTPAAVGGTFNLGSGREISIGDLARLIASLVGREITIEGDSGRLRPDGSEVGRLLADSGRARSILGWKPEVGLEEGLQRTIEWIRRNPERFREREYAV